MAWEQIWLCYMLTITSWSGDPTFPCLSPHLWNGLDKGYMRWYVQSLSQGGRLVRVCFTLARVIGMVIVPGPRLSALKEPLMASHDM